jgi:hypothetical protein
VHDMGRKSVGLICGLVIAATGLIATTPALAAAPTAVTQAPTSITDDGATLNGTVNPGGEVTAYTFEYGPNLSFGNITTVEFTAAGGSPLPVTAPLTGLSANTTYFYRLVATNGTSTSNGVVFGFTTSGPAAPPSVTTGSASSIGAYQAILAGTVNPNGRQTAFTFEYGPTQTFGHITAVDNGGSAGVVSPVTLPVTGLSPTTLYYYRLVATNTDGTTSGPILSFTTAADQAPTDLALSNASVEENQPVGTDIGTLSTVDPDPGDSHTYTLVAGAGDDDNASFQTNGNILETNAVFNFEADSSYSVRVRTTDLDNKFFEKQLTITITDVVENQAPTNINLSNASVLENQPAATTVGTLSAVDPDAGNTHTFTLVAGTGSDDNASFQIAGSTLKTNAVFDFETKSSYTIRVRATDQGNLSTEKAFTITITDVPENVAPTDITLTPTSVNENQPLNTVVGALAAVDTAGDTHTFTLVAGTGSTDNASFNISGGNLRMSAVFNFEAKSSYTIRVQATDQGNLSTQKQFTIAINDVNEAPVTTNDSYTSAIGNTRYVLGTTSTGARVVGSGSNPNANDTDPDAGNTVTCVPETVASTGGGAATINANCSYIFSPGVGDKNQNDTFTYKATDGTLQTNGTVTVAITNNLVWYVDRDAVSNGNGTSHSPLQNLAGVNGAGGAGDSDGASDVIFLYDSASAYTGGIPLEASQQLLGEPQGLTVNAVSLVPAAGGNPVVQNSGGTAIALANDVTIRRVNVGSSSGDGISGASITNADIGGSSTVSGVTGADFKLSGAATGTITFGPAITNTAGRSVDIQNRSGGTVTMNGTISDTGTGVFLNSNTGATIAFPSDVDVSSGASPAFTATAGGTVTAVGGGKTLATTTGTALNVNATTIGSGGLNFQSIAANGAGSGIILNNTGTTAGLTVPGTGAVPSGGTIQNTTGPGISMTNTDLVSLNNMAVTGANQSGIEGVGVTGFSYTNGSVTNAGDSKTDALDAAFAFNSNQAGTTNNVDGALTITNTTITNPYGSGIDVFNRVGTISDAVITGNTITSATSAADSKEDGISFNLLGNTSNIANLTKATIQNNSVNNFPSGGGIIISGGNSSGDGVGEAAPPGTYGTPGSATNVITITGNLVHGDPATKFNGSAISTGVAGRGQGNFVITNNGTGANPLTNVAGVGIGAGIAGNVTATFVITGNVLAPNNEFNSSGISVATDRNIQADLSTLASPIMNATVSTNTISNSDGSGIRVLQSNSNGTFNLKLQNNIIGAPVQAFEGLSVENGSSANVSFNPTLCATISGNTAGSGPPDAFGDKNPGITLIKRSTLSTTYVFGITGLTPSPATAAQAETYVTGQNPNSALGAGFWAGKRVGVVSGTNFTSCTLPF